MSYLLVTYHWPLLTRPQVAGFECPVTLVKIESKFYGLEQVMGKRSEKDPAEELRIVLERLSSTDLQLVERFLELLLEVQKRIRTEPTEIPEVFRKAFEE